MLVQNIIRTKSSNHSQQAQHPEVKETSSRKTSSQEHDYWFRGCLMEALQTLKVCLVLMMHNSYLRIIQDKRREAREENRCPIQKF